MNGYDKQDGNENNMLGGGGPHYNRHLGTLWCLRVSGGVEVLLAPKYDRLFSFQGHMDADVQDALLQIINMRQELVC